MRRIGVLSGFAEDNPDLKMWLAGFQQGLEKLGWSEGRNVRVDYRFAAGRADLFQGFAKELVALQPDVILAQGTGATATLQRESRAIPIVFVTVSDPIGSGFVDSLRARAAISLACCSTRRASPVNGWQCSRRLRHALLALRS